MVDEEKFREVLNTLMDKYKKDSNFSNKIKVWQMSPGEQARYLDKFHNSERIFLGWGKVGDLSQVNNLNKDIIRNLLKEKEDIKQPGSSVTMLYNFYYTIKKDDIVVLRKGYKKVVGICEVIGDYEYLNDNNKIPANYNHSRKVKFLWYNPDGVDANDNLRQVQDTLIELNWDSFVKILEKILNENKNEYRPIPKTEEKDEIHNIDKILDNKGQIILYGVPGTGKTYLARNYVKIKTDNDKNKYKFTTFHQSYSYEDFIEGFRPKNDENGNIIYEVEDGIFKRMCILAVWDALKDNTNNQINENSTDITDINSYLDRLVSEFKEWYESKDGGMIENYRKEILKSFKEFYENLLHNNKITEKELRDFHIFKLWSFDNRKINMVIGENGGYRNLLNKLRNALLSDSDEEKFKKLKEIKHYGNAIVTEILGKIFPEKFLIFNKRTKNFLKDVNIYGNGITNNNLSWNDYKNYINHFEKLKEKLKSKLDKDKVDFYDVDFFIYWYDEVYSGNNSEEEDSETHNHQCDISITNIDEEKKYKEIKKIVIQKLREHKKSKSIFKEEDFQNAPKYYLIIDEINRGNVSNILGELITLLEKDKRLGEDNEIITTLPYSKEPFAVPPNLYIIGTMNTADRSIALLDIALRRRFGFMEIEPDYEKLKDKCIEGINLAKLLKALNEKITKSIDKDHRIGHSYFLKVKNIEDLKFVWYYEIIPLLEEYFYGNIDELKNVIGEEFIENDDSIKELNETELIHALKNIISNNQGE